MAKRICTYPGCDRPHFCHGWCSFHDGRVRRYGSPDKPPTPTRAERFWRKVDKTETCWLWTGSTMRNGYGQFWDGRLFSAHRWIYEQTHGAVPAGYDVDHLCRVRSCVRLDHLESVTHTENVRRGLRGRMVTHCPQGHEYTPENTRGGRSRRACLICVNNRARARHNRRKALKEASQ